MFGFQRRGVRRCENDTLLPKPGPLPHTSQTEATGSLHLSDSQIGLWDPGIARPVVEEYPTNPVRREPGVLAQASGPLPTGRAAGFAAAGGPLTVPHPILAWW